MKTQTQDNNNNNNFCYNNSNNNNINNIICSYSNCKSSSSNINNKLPPFLVSLPTLTLTCVLSDPSISNKTLTLTLTSIPLPTLTLIPSSICIRTLIPTIYHRSSNRRNSNSSSSRRLFDPGTRWSSRWRTKTRGGSATRTSRDPSLLLKMPARGLFFNPTNIVAFCFSFSSHLYKHFSFLHFLQVCHEHGVIHRDLKPENFLFADSSETAPLKSIWSGLCRIALK